MGRWNAATIFEFRIRRDTFENPCDGVPVVGETSDGDSENGVGFVIDVCGEAFGENTLATTVSWARGTRTTQSNIHFNNALSWKVYDGPYQRGQWAGVVDFRRVAVHELGHALGLNHEDDVPAIMATSIFRGDTIVTPQADDHTRRRSGAHTASQPRSERLPARRPELLPVRRLPDDAALLRSGQLGGACRGNCSFAGTGRCLRGPVSNERASAPAALSTVHSDEVARGVTVTRRSDLCTIFPRSSLRVPGPPVWKAHQFLRLSQPQPIRRAQRQACLDRQIRVSPLATPRRAARRAPHTLSLITDPNRQITPLAQALVIFCPVDHSVLRLIKLVPSRCVELMWHLVIPCVEKHDDKASFGMIHATTLPMSHNPAL